MLSIFMKNVMLLILFATAICSSTFPSYINIKQKNNSPTPTKKYIKSKDLLRYEKLLNEFGINKMLPKGFEIQALVALSHFPELKNEHIKFRFKKAKVAHASSPSIISVFKKAKNRKYVITISTQTNEGLDSTRLVNLSYNAQIGVLGHELAHIAEYQTLNFLGMCKFGLHYIKEKDIIATENSTDKITINHGLGYQLLAWSNEVHGLHIKDGRGDRYLSPQQIMELIESNSLYKSL